MSSLPLGRLSTRRGLSNDDDVLHEGVPEHLQGILHGWTVQHLGLRDSYAAVELDGRLPFLEALAVRYRVPVQWNEDALMVIVNPIYQNPEYFLDVVDGHLQSRGGGSSLLGTYLTVGGSAWEVVDEPVPHLERRVSDEQRDVFQKASSPSGPASDLLRQAWVKTYGRQPDPTGAWGDAVKAVEVQMKPIVLPADAVATLGKMIPALVDAPHKWAVTLLRPKKIAALDALVGMLRLIYPNPGRHDEDQATQSEAEHAVGIAVTLVSLLHDGVLRRVETAEL